MKNEVSNEQKITLMERLGVMSDEEIINNLLSVDEVPERTVALKRLKIPVTIKGLTGKQVYRLREQCTNISKDKKGNITKELDTEAFNSGLIAAATVKPNWGDERLKAKHKASCAEEVIKRMLMAGEIDSLGDLVLEVSEFNKELEEVKNSSAAVQ